MVDIRPRSDWQDPAMPVKGPAMTLRTTSLIPAHYTAASKIPSDTANYLRSIQRDYTVNRGYSIGYNFAIDKAGVAWECRGFDIRCAANKGVNDTTIAILCLVDGAAAMNSAMVATFKAVAGEAQRKTVQNLLVVGHRDIGSTACPGDGIYGQVKSGQLEPATPTKPTTPSRPTTPPQKPGADDMATAILHVPGRHAQFISSGTLQADGTVHCVWASWLGPGGEPFVDDHSNAPGVIHQDTLPDTLKRDIIFLGNPEDINDSTGGWSNGDFFRVIRS